MIHRHNIGFRTDKYSLYDKVGDNAYDYEKHGVLTKCLPKILFKGNSILVSFLQFLDMRIIMTLKYIDRVKKFKWISQLY